MSTLASSSSGIFRALLALPLLGVLAASCGGNVVVDKPASCEDGLTVCGAACVDLSANPEHCGDCDADCGEGACQNGECSGATSSCSGGLAACGGSCVDLQKDDANCGSCGNVCPADWQCDTGYCEFFGCVCTAVCSAFLMDPVAPQTVGQSTVAVGDSITPVCGPPGGADVSFSFAAPAAGFYTFRTTGSEVDTTVQVMSAATCKVLACDELVPFDNGGMLGLELAENEIVILTVDTPKGEGEIQLTVVGEEGCIPCVEFSVDPDPQEGLCAGSLGLHKALEACICDGPCAGACPGVCSGGLGNEACESCVSNQNTGCGKAFSACLDDG